MAVDTLALLNRAPRWMRRAATAMTQGRGPLGGIYDRLAPGYGQADIPALPAPASTAIRLVIGPANEAEQGYQWARAFEREVPSTSAIAMMGIDPGGYSVRADLVVPTPVYLRSREWHDSFDTYLRGCTHLIMESGMPLLGRRHRSDAYVEARHFAEAGLRVAMMFHGSDLRLPSQHARESVWSPFTDPTVPSALMEDRASRNIREVARLGLPAFVSTPDLLRYLPQAIWCPVVIDPAQWATQRVAVSDRPVVLHAPSNSGIKGSERVEPVLRALEAEGLIEYRRVSGLRHEQMRRQYAEADIVLDQFLIGSYGVVACEAMAAGSIVIGHVDDAARRSIAAATGQQVPIVEATVESVGAVLRGLVADRQSHAGIRAQGIAYVDAVHDARVSAAAVRGFLES